MEFERIREKFLNSKKYLNRVKSLLKKKAEELENDLDLQLISERSFEILSQTLLDICSHIIANSIEGPPESYADCMKKLGQLEIIQKETAQKMTELVKMRNIIVHQYGTISYKLLLDGLDELYQDFPQFEREILSWIQSKEKK